MRKLSFVLLLVAALATPALAGEVRVGATYGPYQTGSGGEFTVIAVTGFDTSHYAPGTTSNVGGIVNSFQTFCIENSSPPEYIYTNTSYRAELSRNAVNGGPGAGADGDPISVGTGWLYSQFATGSWQNGLSYNYGANRSVSADAFQKTIWWLEGEGGLAYSAGNMYMAAVVAKFSSACAPADLACAQAAAKADGGWNYGVYAINMWDKGTGGLRQDQLFYVPDGGATLMLLGGALMALRSLRGRFKA